MEVWGKNIGILINRTILNDRFARFSDLKDLVKPGIEELDLKVERPTLHICIKIVQVRIIIDILIMRFPHEMFAKYAGQSSFARSDIPRYCNVHGLFFRI